MCKCNGTKRNAIVARGWEDFQKKLKNDFQKFQKSYSKFKGGPHAVKLICRLSLALFFDSCFWPHTLGHRAKFTYKITIIVLQVKTKYL
jgi:hypothetical protein